MGWQSIAKCIIVNFDRYASVFWQSFAKKFHMQSDTPFACRNTTGMKRISSRGTQDSSGPLMQDVAREAGVAISTVSRALANPDRVNEKTRSKVIAAAQKLGYTPNANARSLRVGKSKIVMIVLPGTLAFGAGQVIPEVLRAIHESLTVYGYNVMIANLDRDEITERHILDLAFGGTARGAIILSSPIPRDGSRSLTDTGLPIVSILLDLSESSVPSVVTNDREVMTDAARALIRLGHKHFFYIAGPPGYHNTARHGGIVDALAEVGLPPENVITSGGTRNFPEGFLIGIEAASDFMRLEEKPTAVFACSDDMALSFMGRMQSLGLCVPDDVSIVGFDGSPVCEFCNPPLSSIEQPLEAMGRAGVELLIERVEGTDQGPARKVTLPSKVVLRGSVRAID
jgi:DNA-binding LacI/PurR family transcriptional regulator